MIAKGCRYHIVRVKYPDFGIPPIRSVSIVMDFQEVFPSELPGIPLEREIDLLPDINCISIPPYQMATEEVKELNLKLKNI